MPGFKEKPQMGTVGWRKATRSLCMAVDFWGKAE